MKKLVTILAPMIWILSGCGETPPALEVTRSITINAGIDDVRSHAGDFCAISVWHPAVETCEISEEGGTTYRILTLGDGAQIKESHDGDTANGYSYTIVEGPLPVENYSSTFEAEGDYGSTTITWTSTFDASGATDEEAKDLIAGIYDGGLSSIADNFSQ